MLQCILETGTGGVQRFRYSLVQRLVWLSSLTQTAHASVVGRLSAQVGLYLAERVLAGGQPPASVRRCRGVAPRTATGALADPGEPGSGKCRELMKTIVVLGANAFSGQDFFHLLLDNPTFPLISP